MFKHKVLIAFTVLLLVGYVFAEKRVKPIPLERLSDPDSPSYVPVPYPKNETEAITDLKYAIKRCFSKQEGVHEVYIGSSSPSVPFENVLLNLLEEKPIYRIGEIVKVKVSVYRGDTSKYAVYAYIEDDNTVSEKSTIHVKTKFVNYTMQIPIQLKSNCNEKYDDGEYDVVIEGLDVEARREIDIEGIDDSLCKESGGKSSSSSSTKFEYDIISKPQRQIEMANVSKYEAYTRFAPDKVAYQTISVYKQILGHYKN